MRPSTTPCRRKPNDPPTDQLDIASELEESERAHGTAKVRAALQVHGADECYDCGDIIPDDRRKAAPWAVRCVYCQGALEARLTVVCKQGGKP